MMQIALFRPVLYAICLMALFACQPKSLPIIPMTPEETKQVETLTAQMTTHCVGRYLVDLPAAFVLNSQASAEIEGVKIEVTPMTKPQFNFAFTGRQKTLERMLQPGADRNRPYLRKVIPLPNQSTGGIFDRAESQSSSDRSGRIYELMAWRNDYLLKATVAATDLTFPEDANDSIAKQLKTDVAEKLAKLLSVYERLEGRSNEEIPTRAGFCIANGFFRGPANEEEKAYVPFHLKDAPDVYFHFASIDNAGKEQQTLLQRAGQVEREMKASGTQTIRKGKKQISGQSYEEWLMKGPTSDSVPGTMFTFLGNEAKDGAANPFIRLELFNGFRIPAPERTLEESAMLKDLKRATLNEATAVALWDHVTSTVRLRPGAF
jgi:hypothetical protein